MDNFSKVIYTSQVIVALILSVLSLIAVLRGYTYQIVMLAINLIMAYIGYYEINELREE